MWWGREFEAIKDFLEFLTQSVPETVRFPQYFESRQETAGQIWLGALALLAACPNLKIDAVVGRLALTKAQNQLLHAKFATSEGQWIDDMIKSVERGEFIKDPTAEFEGLSIEQIKAETQQLIAHACRLDRKSLDRLNSNRRKIARAYGATEIYSLLPTIFTNPIEMSLVFDIPNIVQNWSKLQEQTNCGSLPAEIEKLDSIQLAADQRILQKVLEHTIHAAARKGLPRATISFEIVLWELQKCINDKRIPSGGLVFDAGHAVAIRSCEIFMTTDHDLAGSVKTIAQGIEKETKGVWKPAVVVNAKQLEEALARLTS